MDPRADWRWAAWALAALLLRLARALPRPLAVAAAAQAAQPGLRADAPTPGQVVAEPQAGVLALLALMLAPQALVPAPQAVVLAPQAVVPAPHAGVPRPQARVRAVSPSLRREPPHAVALHVLPAAT
jgi:hypothetical protein